MPRYGTADPRAVSLLDVRIIDSSMRKTLLSKLLSATLGEIILSLKFRKTFSITNLFCLAQSISAEFALGETSELYRSCFPVGNINRFIKGKMNDSPIRWSGLQDYSNALSPSWIDTRTNQRQRNSSSEL